MKTKSTGRDSCDSTRNFFPFLSRTRSCSIFLSLFLYIHTHTHIDTLTFSMAVDVILANNHNKAEQGPCQMHVSDIDTDTALYRY